MSLVDHQFSSTATAKPAPRRRQKPADAGIVVRGLELADRDHVAAILEHLSWQSRVQRFLAPRPILSERDLSMITSVDGFNRAGAIAFAGDAPIGAAHYVRSADPEVAEIAIAVVDDWQRRGVGRLLVGDLRTRALGPDAVVGSGSRSSQTERLPHSLTTYVISAGPASAVG
jgi:GNAT superfamily N-acetyltransferase